MQSGHEECASKQRIFYCHIDDFYSGDSTEIKTAAIIREAKRRIDGRMQMNLKDLFEEILEVTRIDMAPPERAVHEPVFQERLCLRG